MPHFDLISDIFSTLSISTSLYFRAELSEGAAVEVPHEKRHIRFHIALEGTCWLTIADGKSLFLQAGDVVLIPEGVAQTLKTAPELTPVTLSDLLQTGAVSHGVLKVGHGSASATLLCGFVQFDEEIDHPVFQLLPDYLLLRQTELDNASAMKASLSLLFLEAGKAGQGMGAIVSRLIEILLVQALSRIVDDANDEQRGFLRAIASKAMSQALRAIHENPAHKWSVENLASLAGQSRSAFARQFSEEVGTPPMEYVRLWRLNKARALLKGSELPLYEIANQCGYECVPSFSRSFKRAFDIGPGAFRRTNHPRVQTSTDLDA